jgi:hypothetical protein
VANLPLRLAVRVHCDTTARQGTRRRRRDPERHYTEGTLGYSRGTVGIYRYRRYTRDNTQRRTLCRHWQSAPSLLSARARVRECPYVSVQGLELLVTVLLTRNRQPPPTVAAGVQHAELAELAEELITLPSGLLAMVCEAIVKLTVRLRAACLRVCVPVHVGCTGLRRGPTRSRLSE